MATLNTSVMAPNVNIRSAGQTKGLGLFAKKALSLTETVAAVERPLLAALDSDRLEDTCYQCYRRDGEIPVEVQLGFMPCPLVWGDGDPGEVKLSRCAGCKTVKYCSKMCQKFSWTAHHSLECPVFKGVYPRKVSNHVRAALRLLLLKQKGRIKDDDWDALMGCANHADEYQRDDQAEELASLQQSARVVRQLLPSDFPEDLISRVLMRVKVNSLTLQTPFHDPLGLVLHPFLAKINHSCKPNSYIRYPDNNPFLQTSKGVNGTIILTPLRKIQAGEEITISYVDETSPVRYCKDELKERYFFTCDCAKCAQEEDYDEKAGAAVRTKRESFQDQAKAMIEEMGRSEPLVSPEDRVKRITEFIHSIWANGQTWRAGQFPFPQMVHHLILAHIDMKNFPQAFRLAAFLHFHLDSQLYPEEGHPLPIVHCMLLYRLAGTIADDLSATPINDDSEARKLSEVLDMDYWPLLLSEKVILSATKTWAEQPWPWLKEMKGRRPRSLLSVLSAEKDPTKKHMSEEGKITTLCIETMDSLRGQ